MTKMHSNPVIQLERESLQELVFGCEVVRQHLFKGYLFLVLAQLLRHLWLPSLAKAIRQFLNSPFRDCFGIQLRQMAIIGIDAFLGGPARLIEKPFQSQHTPGSSATTRAFTDFASRIGNHTGFLADGASDILRHCAFDVL